MKRWVKVGVVCAAARLMAVGSVCASEPVGVEPVVGLREVPVSAVEVTGGFWGERQKVNRERTVWYVFEQCEKTGRIENLRAAGDAVAGEARAEYKFQGYFFNDSDVYKAVEGAADILLAGKDLAPVKDEKLDAYLDELIAVIARAQHPDGYINSYYTVAEPGKRWTNLKDKHELYCGGHLIEAGVAHYQATGKRSLLDVAIRFADHVDRTFGADKRREVCGHEEIELALVKLWRETGEKRYLELAKFFVDERGHANGRELYGEYAQDVVPVREQREIVGHAVRGMYLFSAVTDLVRYTGDRSYEPALEGVWRDLTFRKTYVTGGIGPSAHNEGFTIPFDLPNDTAYAETCAGIGSVLWNQRLGLLYGEAKYADAMERALYNGVLSGISLSGDRFFYVNPLATRGGVRRQEWFSCACCPPNILRLVAGIGGYAYGASDDAVYVNLYMDSRVRVAFKGGAVSIAQSTKYPWDGRVELAVAGAGSVELHLRMPEWARAAKIAVNGAEVKDIGPVNGYMVLKRAWSASDRVVVEFEMPVERVAANPAVKSDAGRVALRRGPVVYGLEGRGRVGALVLPRDAEVTAEYKPDVLGGVMVLKGSGARIVPEDEWAGELYRPVARAEKGTFTAVPYYAWGNRNAGGRGNGAQDDDGMTVWIPEMAAVLGPGPVPWVAKATASYCWPQDTLKALYDRREAAGSGDESIPRMTWWDHRGTDEWVEYQFDKPRKVKGAEVYWFDDSGRGHCRVPDGWRVMYREGKEWKAVKVKGEGSLGVEKDKFNAVEFEPVVTDGLRLEVKLRAQYSGGILEWRVVEERH